MSDSEEKTEYGIEVNFRGALTFPAQSFYNAFWKQNRYLGALGENRKAGENPARARHCKWGVIPQEATTLQSGKARESSDPQVRRPAQTTASRSTRRES
jgi:hypothetical protein